MFYFKALTKRERKKVQKVRALELARKGSRRRYKNISKTIRLAQKALEMCS